MRIASVRIQNLRSFKDEVIQFDEYTCIVGPNGAGKSNIFCALNIFFGEDGHSGSDLKTLEQEDFHNKDVSVPIRISVTFSELSEEAKNDLKAYVRHDKLVVTAVAEWDPETKSAPVVQCGERLVIKDFSQFFEAEKSRASATRLKEIFSEIRKLYPNVRHATIKDDMRAALREFEEQNPQHCQLVESPDEFYGISKGSHILGRHLQWVFVPAVKDATDERREAKDTALGRLLARTVRTKVSFKEKLSELRNEMLARYQTVLAESQGVLDDLSKLLTDGLGLWATPEAAMGLEWQGDREKAVQVAEPYAEVVAKDGSFSGALCRFGHGLQRSYLLALLQLIAASGADDKYPTLILACEEPELFQHPPQARHLADLLVRLSEQGTQIAVCTHSPNFVRGKSFENVRLIRRDQNTYASKVSACQACTVEGELAKAGRRTAVRRDPALARLEQELNVELNEIFFSSYIVLVEGIEDLAYLRAHLYRNGLVEKFRALGGHIVPVHGKSKMATPVAVMRNFNIPFYCIFDADGDVTKHEWRRKHELDNRCLSSLLGVVGLDAFPVATHWGSGVTIWPTNMTSMVEQDFGTDAWRQCHDQLAAVHGCPGGMEKSAYFIPEFLEIAWSHGLRSSSLDRLCAAIVNDAESRLGRRARATAAAI